MQPNKREITQINETAEKCRDCAGNCDICSTYNYLTSLDDSDGSE